MATVLKQAWWSLLLRGILALLLAILLLFAPGVTLATGAISFALLFGIFALAEGVSTIVGSILRREGQWFLMLLLGLVGVVAGVITLGNPLLVGVMTITVMAYIVAFKSIAGGIVEMISAWQIRQEIENEWLLALNGLFSLVFGLILLRRPITGVEVLILISGFFLLVSGVLQVILAFKVRGWSGKAEAAKAATSA
jgi:uncharacterized membrane protein HdeD (DUF308 family)